MTKPTWITTIKFLCFDVDGTLYRNVPQVWDSIKLQAYREVMKEKKWDMEKTENEFGRLYKKLGSSTKVLEKLGINGQNFFINAFKKVNFRKIIKPNKDLREMINNLKRKYIVGILSNGNKDSVKRKLSAAGLNISMFCPSLTTYEFGILKPDPEPFLEVIKMAGVKPEQSVYIGDREETDILGARNVKMKTLIVGGKSKFADLSITDIRELKKYFI